MAEKYQVDARLMDGIGSVDNSATFVDAAAKVGYQQLQNGQLSDLYGAEAGMDLDKLDADRSLLENSLTSINDALATQRHHADKLTELWEGKGADAANAFIAQHNDTAGGLSESIGAAAKTLQTLRESLWDIVDGKVSESIDIDDTTSGHRSRWLDAASTLNGGGGRRDSAHEIADGEIAPYVQNQIANRWLPVMQAAGDSESKVYNLVIGALNGIPKPQFEAPGELGPDCRVPHGRDVFGPAAPGSGHLQAAPGYAGAGQTSPGGYPSSGGDPMGGMDPGQMISGVASPLAEAGTSAIGGIGQLVGGIVGAVTEALQAIPFGEMGAQHDPGVEGDVGHDASNETNDAHGAKDGQESGDKPGDAMGTEKHTSEVSGDSKQDAEAASTTAPTDGKPEVRHGMHLTGSGVAEGPAATGLPGQSAAGVPGVPLGPPPGPVPSTAGAPASTALGQQPATPQAPQQPPAPAPQAAVPAPPAAVPPLAASPLPSAGPGDSPARAQATVETGETPCEIAADELPKVGR